VRLCTYVCVRTCTCMTTHHRVLLSRETCVMRTKRTWTPTRRSCPHTPACSLGCHMRSKLLQKSSQEGEGETWNAHALNVLEMFKMGFKILTQSWRLICSRQALDICSTYETVLAASCSNIAERINVLHRRECRCGVRYPVCCVYDGKIKCMT
jgi:hypothetical protein